MGITLLQRLTFYQTVTDFATAADKLLAGIGTGDDTEQLLELSERVALLEQAGRCLSKAADQLLTAGAGPATPHAAVIQAMDAPSKPGAGVTPQDMTLPLCLSASLPCHKPWQGGIGNNAASGSFTSLHLVPAASCIPALQSRAAIFCLEQYVTCLLESNAWKAAGFCVGWRLLQQCLRCVALSTCSPRPDSIGGL